MNRSGARLILVVLLGLPLTACAASVEGRPTDTDSSPDPPARPMPTAEPIEITGHPRLGGAVLVYERSGGFAGTVEKWTFYPDGRVISADGTRQRVSPAEVAELIAAIEELGFYNLTGTAALPGQCADCVVHLLSMGHDDNFNSVSVTSGATTPDDPGLQAVQRVAEFLSRMSSEG